MNERCAREGCNNPLKTGKKYCSTDCANKANAAKRVEAKEALEIAKPRGLDETLKVIRGGQVPPVLEDMLIEGIGYTAASVVLNELELQMGISSAELDDEFGIQLDLWPAYLRKNYPIGSFSSFGVSVPRPSRTPPTKTSVEPDTGLYPFYSAAGGYMSDTRDGDMVTFADIDRLMRLGPYVFASRIKKGPIMSALSGKRKWKVECNDIKLKSVVEADLERVFLRYTTDILTALDYGVAFGSVIWNKKTAEDIGAGKGVGRDTRWFVVDKIQWAHPDSVKQILRDEKTMEFAGYVHWRKAMKPTAITIDPMQALVITYDSRFGNMWGFPMAEVIYDFAFWYEVVMRAFLRYLQRMGTPVTVVYGPNKGHSRRPDGTKISNPEYGLLLAGAAAMSSGIYIPNEFDLQTGQPLWRIEYLSTDQKGEQFHQALTYLSTQITRGVVIGDRAATQDDIGGYNIGQIHDKLTQVDNDMIFKSIVGQLNPYLVRRYAQFNRDYNNPPKCTVKAEVIDPVEQEVLMKLFATAGNVKRFDGSPLDRIDWEEAFRSIHAPILSDEDYEAQRKQELDNKAEAQERSMETAQKYATPPNQGQPGGGGNGNRPPGGQDQSQKARLSIIDHLAEGGSIPVLLTLDQVREFFAPEDEGEIMLQRHGRRSTKTGKPVKDPEFESKHARDASGKFASKDEEAEEEEGGKESEDDRDKLDEEPWPGAGIWTDEDGTEHQIKGIINLDGVEYTVLDGVSKEEVLAIHEANMRANERGSDLIGRPMQKIDTLVIPNKEGIAMAVPNFFKGGGENGLIVIDTTYTDNEDFLEQALFHENLHAQPREQRPHTNADLGNGGTMAEEAFNGIVCNMYTEKYGLSTNIGWSSVVSTLAYAAQQRGWTKQELYNFALKIHSVDGDAYRPAIEGLLSGTGTKYISYLDSLDNYWPDWASWERSAEEIKGYGETNWPTFEYDDWKDGTE